MHSGAAAGGELALTDPSLLPHSLDAASCYGHTLGPYQVDAPLCSKRPLAFSRTLSMLSGFTIENAIARDDVPLTA